ncbi:hypothetical protein IM697_18300 [Streptomyces ferrugineus]|uniref:Uncharacterized protein n=1 Tax=Streptomyces ferrugineus TaxID=1413221 RepID=A0A7M2SX03_9ACTN|nr:hypothetical protein [Streptomyces ferrugineus]QOV40175.1 hypothetical protein IM697_18300 [Streptomyces ferrugineus]
MHTPHDLDLAPDEVLVQSVDTERRVVELRPHKLSELDRTDVLHATQVLDPGDHALNTYALLARASNCMKKDGTHWYVMANQKDESC